VLASEIRHERKSADNTLWQPHSSAYTPQRGRHLNRYVYSHPNWELNWSCIAPLPLVHRLSGRLRPWGGMLNVSGGLQRAQPCVAGSRELCFGKLLDHVEPQLIFSRRCVALSKRARQSRVLASISQS